MIVHKFGGTSVGDATRFARVADIVARCHKRHEAAQPEETVVVVSAMSGVTDQLIAGARAAADGQDAVYCGIKASLLNRHLQVVESVLADSRERPEALRWVEDRLYDLERLCGSIAVLGELTARGRDAVASFGEQLSAYMLAAVLRDRGVPAQRVSATEVIVTDDAFGRALPLSEPTGRRLKERVRPLLESSIIPVITGYIGATEQGVTTTLGRGGSDYSAALVGAGLCADQVWIWSDVNGILTADPSIVPEARTISELSYLEAAELAYFGADVLHPKTIRPLVDKAIPLRLLNTFNPNDPGTLIVSRPNPDRERWPAIISSRGLSMIAVGTRDDAWTPRASARALELLSDAGVEVFMFSQSFSEHSLNLVVDEQNQCHSLTRLQREFSDEKTYSIGCKERVAIVSTVGVPDWNGGHIVSHVFAALGKCGTRVIAVAQAATEYSVSICIPEDQLESTVRFLHRELGLER
ncbi:MAG: aspartate kinase [Acidobacteria bacterium]|nr:MAG: aspartate kinase [Acidobacteriota bacterium]